MKVINKNNLPVIKISEVIPFQHELKDLTAQNYSKLKKVLEKRGFEYPIYIWKNNGKNYLMDGHGRQRVMLKEGWDLEVPYFEIQAKDEQEAAEKLLEITSQYQTTTQEGLDNYIATYKLNEAEVYEATSFDATRFYQNDTEERINDNKEVNPESLLSDGTVECPRCKFEFET